MSAVQGLTSTNGKEEGSGVQERLLWVLKT